VKQNPYVRHMFAGANTTEGFVSFFDEILKVNTNKVFIIKGGPGVGKSTFMKKISQDLLEKGYTLECFNCSSDPASLDALAVPDLKVAIMDGTAPHVMEPRYPGAVDQLLNFGEYWDDELIAPNRDRIIECAEHGSWLFNTAYSQLREGRIAYNEWKSHIAKCLDRSKYQHMVNSFVNELFDKFKNKEIKNGTRHFFACAITPLGIRDYAATLFTPGMEVYPVYGRPGSGAKEVISRVAQIAQWLGYSTERAHCPVEPGELDMVIIPELNTAVINIWEPVRNSLPEIPGVKLHKGLNLEDCLFNGTDYERYRKAADDARKRFTALLDKAVEYIARAKAVHDELEGYYIPAVDFEKIEQFRRQIVQRMLAYSV